MRSNVVAIAAVIVALFLGYRQWAVERQLEQLRAQLGAAVAPAPEKEASGSAPKVAPAAPSSHEERLRTLELALASLRADVRSLEKATADLPQEKAVTDQQILSVLKEQNSKVVENQLKYHRERWLDQREAALSSFTKRFNLDQGQNDQLWGLLSGEIDKMVAILRNPQSFEDPENAVQEWKQLLLDTDAAAHKVLQPQAAVAWDQQRMMERKVLWPWLPE
ncbi:MAG TPA: hypothetical protein VJV78_36215 [Polyangiales bacterium]|nr:hypothetical protein [Polyangiales bacterium]